MDSKVYENNFQLFPATKKANFDKETDVGKFVFFCIMHFVFLYNAFFYAYKFAYSASPRLAEFRYVFIISLS